MSTKPELYAARLNELPRKPILAVILAVILLTFCWEIIGFRRIQRGDFIDDSKLQLKSSAGQESILKLEKIASLHLLGDVAANAVAPPPLKELPKTDLKLVLVGAMTDSDPKKASALIQANNQAQRFYIGDNIPGGAVLQEVLANSVVLKRNDRFESLSFPRGSDTGATVTSNAYGDEFAPRAPANVAKTVQPARSDADNDLSLVEKLQVKHK